jgi:two-component system sensor histidine kinase HydH
VETLFAELKRYVGWRPEHEAALRALRPSAAPHFQRIADEFYARILEHEAAARVLLSGESSVGHLKVKLVAWMDRLLAGPWDEDYFDLRCTIGRVHVRIGLAQHYMFGAMNLLRDELKGVVEISHRGDAETMLLTQRSIGKILDLELAIMLHTYREDLEAQNARSERLATFGQLIGSIGHELRNPLGVMESSLYILDQRVEADERAKKHVLRIREQVRVANGIVSALLDMIRDRPLSWAEVRIAELMDDVLASVTVPLHARVSVSGLESLAPVAGDPMQLRQLFVNLVDNALQAIDGNGEVRVIGRVDADRVEVAVEDTGPGVDAETRRRLFEPLITTKTKGIGLGLALVKRIAERHGGEVRYAPRAELGARFVVRLPASAAARPATAAKPTTAAAKPTE